MSESFNVILPCKTYVKQFIVHNFGEPANFSPDKSLSNTLLKALKHPDKRWDYNSNVNDAVGNYRSKIDLAISEDVFYRYGWMLTTTDILNINRKIESRVKCFMYQMVGVSVANGKPIKDSIEDFQQRFDYPEEVWAYESIKKDFQRNGKPIARSYQDEIILINQRLFMDNLSRMGTLYQKAIKHYEKLHKTA